MTRIRIYNADGKAWGIWDAIMAEHDYAVPMGSIYRYTLMQEEYVEIPFHAPSSKVSYLSVGAKCDVEGIGVFVMTQENKPTWNKETGGWDYMLRFDRDYWGWASKIFRYAPKNDQAVQTSFSLTASIQVHAQLLVDNIIKLIATGVEGNGYSFVVDDTVEQSAKNIAYNGDDIIAAMGKIAQTFDCEWWITDNVIHFGKCLNGGEESAVTLEQDVNVQDMSSGSASDRYFNRLFVLGGTKNLPKGYYELNDNDIVGGIVTQRLMLPETDGGRYLGETDDTKAVEAVIINDAIFPKRVATISDVTIKDYEDEVEQEDGSTITQTWEAYRYKDEGLVYDNEYTIDTLRVTFESGKLNGMTFEVIFNPDGLPLKLVDEETGEESINPDAQTWEIVRNEDYGLPLPNDTLKPADGDKAVLTGFDITYLSSEEGDTAYIKTAEKELKDYGEKILAKHNVDPATYTCTMMAAGADPTKCEEYNFDMGQPVLLVSGALFADGSRKSRIIGFTKHLDRIYDSPVYEVGESVSYGVFREIDAKLDELAMTGRSIEVQGGGGSDITLIKRYSTLAATDSNVYSARRSDYNYVSKQEDDVVNGKLTFRKGFDSKGDAIFGNFAVGWTGAAIYQDDEGSWHIETDYMTVRKKFAAKEVQIQDVHHVGGQQLLTAAACKVVLVEDAGSEWICYFLAVDSDGIAVNNTWRVGDQAYVQTFNLMKQADGMTGNHFLWRMVTGKSNTPVTIDDVDYHWIRLSKSNAAEASDEPKAGDNMVCLGHQRQVGEVAYAERQAALILAGAGEGAPYQYFFKGIGSKKIDGVEKPYYLGEPEIQISTESTVIKADKIFLGTKSVEDELDEQKEKQAELAATITGVQGQLDGEIQIWQSESEAAPTLEDEPANEWVTDEIKNLHLGDYLVNSLGMVYQFVFKDGAYQWEIVTDQYLIDAVNKALHAQATADGAVDRLDELDDDYMITPNEKIQILRELVIIEMEHSSLKTKVEYLQMTTDAAYVAYEAIYKTWTEYLGELTSPSSMKVTTELSHGDKDDHSSRDYYEYLIAEYSRCKQDLQNAIVQKAQDTANEALGKLDDYDNDYMVTESEKVAIKENLLIVQAEYTSLSNKAVSLGMDKNNKYQTAYQEYQTAFALFFAYFTNLATSEGTTELTDLPDFDPDTIDGFNPERMSEEQASSRQYYEWIIKQYSRAKQEMQNAIVQKAQDTGDEAQNELDEIAADDIITPVEKLRLQLDMWKIDEEYNALMDAADGLIEDTSAVTTAYTALKTMMDVICADLNTSYYLGENNNYTKAQYKEIVQNYSVEKQNLQNAIVQKAQDKAEQAGATAGAAQDAASEALRRLNQIDDDGYITPDEKADIRSELVTLTGEHATLVNNAKTLGVEYTAYSNVFGRLRDMLLVMVRNPSQTSQFGTNGLPTVEQYNSTLQGYISEKTKLQTAIIQKGKDTTDILDEKIVNLNANIEDITGDLVIYPSEKTVLLYRSYAIDAEHTALYNSADKVGLINHAKRRAYSGAKTLLKGKLDEILANLSEETVLTDGTVEDTSSRAYLNYLFSNYESKKGELQQLITTTLDDRRNDLDITIEGVTQDILDMLDTLGEWKSGTDESIRTLEGELDATVRQITWEEDALGNKQITNFSKSGLVLTTGGLSLTSMYAITGSYIENGQVKPIIKRLDTSGLVTVTDGKNNFAQLFSNAVDEQGAKVAEAFLKLYTETEETENGEVRCLSGIMIKGDSIDISGGVTFNEFFKIQTDGRADVRGTLGLENMHFYVEDHLTKYANGSWRWWSENLYIPNLDGTNWGTKSCFVRRIRDEYVDDVHITDTLKSAMRAYIEKDRASQDLLNALKPFVFVLPPSRDYEGMMLYLDNMQGALSSTYNNAIIFMAPEVSATSPLSRSARIVTRAAGADVYNEVRLFYVMFNAMVRLYATRNGWVVDNPDDMVVLDYVRS